MLKISILVQVNEYLQKANETVSESTRVIVTASDDTIEIDEMVRRIGEKTSNNSIEAKNLDGLVERFKV